MIDVYLRSIKPPVFFVMDAVHMAYISLLRSSVPHLLLICRPMAIFRAIVAVHVYAIYRKCFVVAVLHGPCNECFGGLFPFLAHFNSASTIFWVILVVWIIASLSDSLPYLVQTRVFSLNSHFASFFLHPFYGIEKAREDASPRLAFATASMPSMGLRPCSLMLCCHTC